MYIYFVWLKIVNIHYTRTDLIMYQIVHELNLFVCILTPLSCSLNVLCRPRDHGMCCCFGTFYYTNFIYNNNTYNNNTTLHEIETNTLLLGMYIQLIDLLMAMICHLRNKTLVPVIYRRIKYPYEFECVLKHECASTRTSTDIYYAIKHG